MSNINDIESVINTGLIHSVDFTRKVLPFIKPDYYQDPSSKLIYEVIHEHFTKYDASPSISELRTSINLKNGSISDKIIQSASIIIDGMETKSVDNVDWLLDNTEKFCKDRSLANAIMKSVSILNGEDKTKKREHMPKMLEEALAITFDNKIGHDYLEDAKERWEYYHQEVDRVKSHINGINIATNGGYPKKTLSLVLAGSNVGKSAFLCDHAAHLLRNGYNVLYISLEMSKEEISRRIDANLLEIPVNDVADSGEDFFFNSINKLKMGKSGRLFVQDYPVKGAGTIQFTQHLNELKLKKGFYADVVIIDYLGLVAASSVDNAAGMYTVNKVVAEDLRAFATVENVAVLSATQTNRGGQSSSSIEMEDVGESHGISQTADLILSLVRTEDLREEGRVLISQVKNRISNVDHYKRFVVGLDIDTMTFFDVEDEMNPPDAAPVFDKTESGASWMNDINKEDLPWEN